jgi:hypothetical protein
MVLDDLFTNIDVNANPKIQITRTKKNTSTRKQAPGTKIQEPKDAFCLIFGICYSYLELVICDLGFIIWFLLIVICYFAICY